MTDTCVVARFINDQIKLIGKPQKDIASESGFETANLITMIKQGKTKLPIAKVGPMAIALETDPIHLLKLCMSTYYPETWEAISLMLDSAFTADEMELVSKLRAHNGGSYLYALTDDSRDKFQSFIHSLSTKSQIN